MNDQIQAGRPVRILFLHHSTGGVIWRGNNPFWLKKLGIKDDVPAWFLKYNKKKGTNYLIEDLIFPKENPYGWHNYPYDYYNIWVKHAGDKMYMEEPTLEILSLKYDVIIWKHCFPVSNIKPDKGLPDIDTDEKMIQHYILQYNALKKKMHEFPHVKFIVWTGAAQVQNKSDKERGGRARDFSKWVTEEWDEEGDNIFIWDFRQLETEGNLFLLNKNARSENNSHPGRRFAGHAVKQFCERVVDVIEHDGRTSDLTGKAL